MATLYEIDKAILECVDAESGEILDADRLDALMIERDEKIEKVALWYKNLLSDAEAYKAEKAVFSERERAAKNKAESLKAWLDGAVAGTPFKTAKVAISYRKSQRVIVDDINAIDPGYYLPREPEVNKTLVKDVLKAGGVVEGAHLEDFENISIR